MMGDDGLAPRGEWWVGVMGRVVSFGELCPAQPANLRRWGSIPSLAASKTLWGQSMLVLWSCATWSARRDHVRRSIRKCEDSRASERGPCESACGRDMSNAFRRSPFGTVKPLARAYIGMWGGKTHVGVESVSQCLPWQ
jgi:hypothetical protein